MDQVAQYAGRQLALFGPSGVLRCPFLSDTAVSNVNPFFPIRRLFGPIGHVQPQVAIRIDGVRLHLKVTHKHGIETQHANPHRFHTSMIALLLNIPVHCRRRFHRHIQAMIGPVAWSQEELPAEISSPEWGTKVLEALRRHFSERRWLLEPAVLIDAGLEYEANGTSVLLAIYDHPYYERRIGLRHRLNDFPMSVGEGRSPAEAMAEDIAVFEISEPFGTWADRLVEDSSGVWWWTWPLDW
jgi:hypothetical protein